MASKEGYDVLRLIEHGQSCYISSEYVEGEILAQWLKYHPHITKERLFIWIQSITRQLSMIHKCHTKPYYQYMNPYSLVITKEEELFFLDLEAGSNERHLRIMQRRAVREAFLPAEEAYYQRASVELDIYGLGRTIQYLLAMSESDPPLTRQEEKRFQKVLSRCLHMQSKLSYQSVAEIRKQIPEYQQKKRFLSIRHRKFVIVAGMAAAVVIAGFAVYAAVEMNEGRVKSAEIAVPEENHANDAEMSGSPTEVISEEKEICLELALVYWLELEDDESALNHLNRIRAEYDPAEELAAVLETFLQEEKERDGDELAKHLKYLESHLKVLEDTEQVEELEHYYRCLVRGYGVLGTEEAASQILSLGISYLEMEKTAEAEEILEMAETEETEETAKTVETAKIVEIAETEDSSGKEWKQVAEKEIREYMAAAYEDLGQAGEAALMYERIIELEADQRNKEEEYQHLVNLYEMDGQEERALDLCLVGIHELPDSVRLKIQHIRLLCEDASVERDVCAQTIQEYISQMPEILEKEEYQKLSREYGIQVKGEKVWVEK